MNTIDRIIAVLSTVQGKTAQEAAAQLSAPIKTPKAAPVTLKTLGGTWGLGRAAEFRMWLMVAGQQPTQLGAIAGTILDLLTGPGFGAEHPDVPNAVAALVAASGCSADEADAVLYDITYPAGETVTATQVGEARAEAARRAGLLAARQFAAGRYNAAIAAIEEREADNDEAPTQAELAAILGGE